MVERAIRAFKYHRRWRLGVWLADAMVATARESLPLERVDVIVPVPLHWFKRRLKGFNPSDQLAWAVSKACGRPCALRALRRRRWTSSQTRLGWQARFRNVRTAFTAKESLVRARTVLLIDDVLTSGATAHACATALRAAGARAVFVLTAARTPFGA
jgi:ComF family protein